jgi:hypothetical protein
VRFDALSAIGTTVLVRCFFSIKYAIQFFNMTA